jgi:hypothetical protein
VSRQTRASVNTCIVLVVSSAGSKKASISDAAARGDGVDDRVYALGFTQCSAAVAQSECRAAFEANQSLQGLMLYTIRYTT